MKTETQIKRRIAYLTKQVKDYRARFKGREMPRFSQEYDMKLCAEIEGLRWTIKP